MPGRSNPRSPLVAQTLAALACASALLVTTPAMGASVLDLIRQPATPGSDRFTAAELEELVGPIALYPDTLLANMLAASVYPEDVAQAASLVAAGNADIDAQAWDEPVKAVARVPDAIKMMGQYPDWVAALGHAYLTQATEVMAAVQNLRSVAAENGSLASTEQQTVDTSGDTIVIVPSDPEVIYVPSYQPSVVYAPYYPGAAVATGIVAFGVGVAVGAAWDNLYCDWHGGCVGWGGNDVDVDIDREFNGDINIGSGNTNIQGGNRARTGQEGNAWSPNQQRASSQARPNATSQYRSQAGAGNRAASPSGGWSGRGTSAGTRPAGGARTPSARPAGGAQQRPAASSRPSSGTRSMPATPPRQSPSARPTTGSSRSSAYSGGSSTRASSNRGNASRSSSGSRSSGGGRSSGGASRGGGGRGGGGRR